MKSETDNRILRHLSQKVREARARGDSTVIFNVHTLADDLRFVSTHRFSDCCQVLDSEAFARREHVSYHHRTGVWGTGDATYTFNLHYSSFSPRAGGVRLSAVGWSWLAFMLAVVFAVVTVLGSLALDCQAFPSVK